MAGNFGQMLRLPRIHFRVLLHASNMRHGTNGFTSLPKEGVLRIFSPWKIQRLRPGLNPRTWVPETDTLPLDHRIRYVNMIIKNHFNITCQYAPLLYVWLVTSFPTSSLNLLIISVVGITYPHYQIFLDFVIWVTFDERQAQTSS